MVNIKTPLIGLQYDDITGTYVANLERQCAAFIIRDVQFRALLELVTGDTYDDFKLTLDNAGPELMQLAEDALVRKAGMNRADARILIAKRWDKVNTPIEITTTQAIPLEHEAATKTVTPAYDAGSKLQDWKERKSQDQYTDDRPLEE